MIGTWNEMFFGLQYDMPSYRLATYYVLKLYTMST